VVRQAAELRGEAREVEGEIDDARVERALRHAGEPGGRRLLHQGHAVLRLDRPQPFGAVGPGAAEHDADGAAAAVGGERAEEAIDGEVRPALALGAPALHDQLALPQLELHARRGDVDVIGLERLAVTRLGHREGRGVAQHLGQVALARGIQVEDHHERQPGVRRHVAQELAQRLDTAGRRAEADDGRRARAPRCGHAGRDPGRRRLGRLLAGHPGLRP
jgi:hypothetical protein